MTPQQRTKLSTQNGLLAKRKDSVSDLVALQAQEPTEKHRSQRQVQSTRPEWSPSSTPSNAEQSQDQASTTRWSQKHKLNFQCLKDCSLPVVNTLQALAHTWIQGKHIMKNSQAPRLGEREERESSCRLLPSISSHLATIRSKALQTIQRLVCQSTVSEPANVLSLRKTPSQAPEVTTINPRLEMLTVVSEHRTQRSFICWIKSPQIQIEAEQFQVGIAAS